MDERMKQRCDQLFAMGLMFNGQSYVGTDAKIKDVNFHYTEIQCDTDEQWDEKISKVEAEMERRGYKKETHE